MARKNEKYHEGAIVRIKLENFMTYDSVEFNPGAHLNVIVAPNGTGKSTLVNAICLGLAGKTKWLGRAAQPSEFIKHGCNKALIEIELYNPDGDNYIIRREISSQQSKCQWSVNGRQALQKAVEETVGRLNIQVGNLCQFLPQDKVSDFAKMTPQELLENTEKAVGPPDMLENHINLKSAGDNAKNMENKLSSLTERLDCERAQNARLEQDVHSYQERQRHLDRIEMMNKKRCWVEYDNKRIEFIHVKEQYKQLVAQYNEMMKENAPIKEKLKKIDNKGKGIEQRLAEISNMLKSEAELAAKNNREIELSTEKIEEAQDDLKSKKNEEVRRQRRAAELGRQIRALESDLASVNTTEDVQPELDELHQEIRNVSNQMTHATTQQGQVNRDNSQITRDIQDSQRQLKQVLDVGRQRLEMLGRRHKDAYQAVQWLRANKQQFKGVIHEPIMLVLNVNDKNFTPFVEQTISFNDLIGFIAEESDDMYKFINIMRKERNLRINVLKAPKAPVDSFKPMYPLEQIKKYGFVTYMRETFTCPDAVMRFLCHQYGVHKIPIGTNQTTKYVQQMQKDFPQLSKFFTPDSQYTTKRSRYGNKELSSRIVTVRPASLLTVYVNVEREQMLKNQLRELQANLSELQAQSQQLQKQLQEFETNMNDLRNKKKELTKKKDLKKVLQQQISVKKQNMARLESEAINIEEEERLNHQKLKAVIFKKAKYLEELHSHTQICLDCSIDKVRMAINLAVNKQEYMSVDEEMKEQLVAVGNLEREIADITEKRNQAKEMARNLLMAAKKAVNLNQTEEISSDMKKAFELYPNKLEELDAAIHEEQARADCTYQIDESVVKDFKDRKKKIESMEANRHSLENKQQEHQSVVENMKKHWLHPLQELITKINKNFHQFFSYLRCAGEVALHIPENEEDYEKYGILIKVQYRENEQLRVLSAHTQSGGERSVATVLYMMALQELARCPFRCVDEINQGMDAFNERRVYELVVKTACRENTSQYFLLTPKLLPDLDYTNNMTVLCIYNGEHMINHTDWTMRKFLRRRGRIV